MGDRCWMQVRIYGPINSMMRAKKIAKLMHDEGYVYGSNGWQINLDKVQDDLFNSHDKVGHWAFENESVNYANAEEIEKVLQQLQQPYVLDNARGDDYSAASTSWSKERGRIWRPQDESGDPVFGTGELRWLLEQEDKVAAINGLLAGANQSLGRDLPLLSLGPAMQREYAQWLAGRVIGVPA